MMVINATYAIKNYDGVCYAICKSKKSKKTGERYYEAKWYLNTLSQAVNFLIDRAIDIPGDLKTMSDDIEKFKKELRNALSGVTLDAG